MAKEGVFFKRPLPSLSTLDESVREQLEVREKLYGKDIAYAGDGDFLVQYLNANNSFVKLTSGIDVVGVDKVGAVPNAAHNNILLGGVLYKGKSKRAGLNDNPFLSEDNSGAYNFAHGVSGEVKDKPAEGYVPMPGIIDFSVKNTGNSGFTRNVSITVKCFSLEQLSILEKLYLRPGFKCLVEWGHVIYGTGNKSSLDSKIYNPETVFSDKVPSGDELKEEKIKEKGSEIIASSQHNYDYMLGMIKNYNWSYDKDGYTIDIQLLGKGAVSTFIKQVYGGTEHEDGAKLDPGVEFASTPESSFGGILKRISQADTKGKQENTDESNIVEECDMGPINTGLKKFKTQMDGITELLSTEGDSFEFKVYRAGFADVNKKAGNKNFNYISMRFLLGMINYFFLPRPSSGDKVPEGKFNTTPQQDFYLTYKNHFSIDPYICLLPQQPGEFGLKTTSIKGYKEGDDKGDILDIQICTDFLYTKYTELVVPTGKKNESQKSIGEYLNIILDNITSSLGQINEFVLYNDFYLKKELGPSRVVDLQALPRPEGQEDNYKMITPKGKASFVTDFSFKSELSNSMINLITSQAIISGTDAGTATTTGLAAFNKGVISRFEDEKGPEIAMYAKARADAAAEAEAKIVGAFKELYSKFKYDEDKVIGSYANGSAIIKKALNESLKESKPKRGHIGAKVTLSMIGIGGLKSLQYFTLPDQILPSAYSDKIKVGFQINNVSHQITNNVWYTTIEANAIILSQG